MRPVENAPNPYAATPAKISFRANEQNSRLEYHRIRSSAQHDPDRCTFLEIAVNTRNEGIPITISGTFRYKLPDIGGRSIDKNICIYRTVFVKGV